MKNEVFGEFFMNQRVFCKTRSFIARYRQEIMVIQISKKTTMIWWRNRWNGEKIGKNWQKWQIFPQIVGPVQSPRTDMEVWLLHYIETTESHILAGFYSDTPSRCQDNHVRVQGRQASQRVSRRRGRLEWLLGTLATKDPVQEERSHKSERWWEVRLCEGQRSFFFFLSRGARPFHCWKLTS